MPPRWRPFSPSCPAPRRRPVPTNGSPPSSAAFEATQSLAAIGTSASVDALGRAADQASSDDVRTAAAWAAGEIRRRSGNAAGLNEGHEVAAFPPAAGPALTPGFRRGVSW